MTEGCVQALLDLRLVQATGFIYDFYFYHETRAPFVRDIRARYFRALATAPPDLIVMAERPATDAFPGYSRLEHWPALADFLQSGYHLDPNSGPYRIYIRNKAGPAPQQVQR